MAQQACLEFNCTIFYLGDLEASHFTLICKMGDSKTQLLFRQVGKGAPNSICPQEMLVYLSFPSSYFFPLPLQLRLSLL